METSESLPATGSDQTELPLMSSAADFPVRTFPRQERGLAWRGSGADYGPKSLDLLASFDPLTSSWRTSQLCLVEGWERFSATWPRSGMMLSGIAYQLPPLALRTAAIVSGLSLTPTPTAGDAKSAANATAGRSEGSEHHSGVTLTDYVRLWPTPNVAGGGNPPDRLKRQGNHFVRPSGKKAHLSLDQAVKLWPSPTARDTKGRDANCREGGPSLPEALYRTLGSGKLNPPWVEWLMGYPIGHTELRPSETP
jgi:hypothetical protein